MKYLNLLIHPVRFFRNQLEKEKLTYWLPILIIIVVSILTGIIAGNTVTQLDLPDDQVAMVKMISIISGIIGSVVSMTAGWLIKSGILNFILKKMNGEGDFKKATYAIGVASFPMVFHAIFNLFFSSPVSLEMSYEFDWINFLSGIFNVFSIWELVLTIIGLSVFYGLSYKKTAVPVIGLKLVTAAVSLVISLVSLNSLSGLSNLEQ
ncbi:Yip1 family protein [Eubacteriaceae bacterium ES2]|nr:Yip1 family protein [Eubacteriaceae bacterium ES2]